MDQQSTIQTFDALVQDRIQFLRDQQKNQQTEQQLTQVQNENAKNQYQYLDQFDYQKIFLDFLSIKHKQACHLFEQSHHKLNSQFQILLSSFKIKDNKESMASEQEVYETIYDNLKRGVPYNEDFYNLINKQYSIPNKGSHSNSSSSVENSILLHFIANNAINLKNQSTEQSFQTQIKEHINERNHNNHNNLHNQIDILQMQNRDDIYDISQQIEKKTQELQLQFLHRFKNNQKLKDDIQTANKKLHQIQQQLWQDLQKKEPYIYTKLRENLQNKLDRRIKQSFLNFFSQYSLQHQHDQNQQPKEKSLKEIQKTNQFKIEEFMQESKQQLFEIQTALKQTILQKVDINLLVEEQLLQNIQHIEESAFKMFSQIQSSNEKIQSMLSQINFPLQNLLNHDRLNLLQPAYANDDFTSQLMKLAHSNYIMDFKQKNFDKLASHQQRKKFLDSIQNFTNNTSSIQDKIQKVKDDLLNNEIQLKDAIIVAKKQLQKNNNLNQCLSQNVSSFEETALAQFEHQDVQFVFEDCSQNNNTTPFSQYLQKFKQKYKKQ